MKKFDMVDAVMPYLDKYQFPGSYNYKDVLATFKQIDSDLRNDEGAFKDDYDVLYYDELAKELYERDKTCKDIRSALAALFIDSQSCSYRAGREFETDTQYHGWRHNTRQIGFETDMNDITVQVPLSSYFDAHFKNKYSYDKDNCAMLYPLPRFVRPRFARRPNCSAIASRIIRLRPVGLDVLSKTKPL